jgi:hypothetical protein
MHRVSPATTIFILCALLATSSPASAQSAPPPKVIEGPSNTAVGQNALGSNTTGTANVAVGVDALRFNTDGWANTATGFGALAFNDIGLVNTATGASALGLNTSGTANTATGDSALYSNSIGSDNVGIGNAALFNNGAGNRNTAAGVTALVNSLGDSNTAVGWNAGGNSNGSYNIYVGAEVIGDGADTNTMRLGLPYDPQNLTGQNRTFIAGIAGTVLTTPAVQVYVDGNGQLGTLVPAPISGAINNPVMAMPRADSARLAALEDLVRQQQATIAELQKAVRDLKGRGARR